jgi:lysozyme family protein
MTQTNDAFARALQFTLKWEGGVGHPQDPAGAVNRGISQATYDTYRQHKKLPPQRVSQLTEAEVEEIYFRYYWQPSKADSMCLPLAVVHFDTAVNFGLRGSVEFLQEAIGGLVVDGDFGSKTSAALAAHNTIATAREYVKRRIDYRHQRVKANPSQQVFLDGWLRRDKALSKYIEDLENPGKGDREDAAIVARLEQVIGLLEEIVAELKGRS